MVRGRKPLDVNLQAHHRQDTLKRYAEKNKEKLREAARLRMQRLRTAVANSNDSTKRAHRLKAHEAAAKYRDKKYIESLGLEAFDTKTTQKFTAKTQCHHEGCPPPKRPITLPEKSKRHESLPEDDEDDESDEECDGELQQGSTRPFFPGHVIAPSAPEVAFLPCGNCGEEGCCGFTAVMDIHPPESLKIYMPQPGGPLLCMPGYFPDPGDEDRARHSATPDKSFFGITSGAGDLIGAIWSLTLHSATFHRILNAYPNLSHIEAPTWLRFVELWNQNCTEYHNHEVEAQDPMSTPSTPPPPSQSPGPSPSTKCDVDSTTMIMPMPTPSKRTKAPEDATPLASATTCTLLPKVVRHFIPHNFSQPDHNPQFQVATQAVLDLPVPLVWISDSEDEGEPPQMLGVGIKALRLKKKKYYLEGSKVKADDQIQVQLVQGC
ncbi:hypothetical protein B0H10DRAFT_1957862 [Mycena sp. CBHHK59/15]|nr:hypothetical protein B0H10DRAFT_1957862 [Mycena sp. CBHHK59/15]